VSWLSCALLGAGLALGCGGASVAVAVHPQPAFAPAQLVDSPPPPAQIEYLSDTPPSSGCRWVDGQWVWTSQRWDWRPGGWIQPPPDCEYSLPSSTWTVSQGARALYYRPGRWYSVTQPKACADPAPCPGADVRSRAEPTRPPE